MKSIFVALSALVFSVAAQAGVAYSLENLKSQFEAARNPTNEELTHYVGSKTLVVCAYTEHPNTPWDHSRTLFRNSHSNTIERTIVAKVKMSRGLIAKPVVQYEIYPSKNGLFLTRTKEGQLVVTNTDGLTEAFVGISTSGQLVIESIASFKHSDNTDLPVAISDRLARAYAYWLCVKKGN